jgi:hypothetical protein
MNLFRDRARQTEMHLHSDAPTQRKKETNMRGGIQTDRKGDRKLGSRKNRQADRQTERRNRNRDIHTQRHEESN